MSEQRIIIYGNSGSGKTTMTCELAALHGIPSLCLDDIAWDKGAVRRSLDSSLIELESFFADHNQWVIEGCYGDLVEAVLPHCTELRLLNPGIEACVAHCKKRPWEPDKYASLEEQNKQFDVLVAWVRDYEGRTDECGLQRHRMIYDQFEGCKREFES